MPITVKRDPQIKLPQIVTRLMETDQSETGQPETNTTTVKQTDVYGVMCPLLALNGMAVDMIDLLSFELDCTGVLPTVDFEFVDRNNLFSQYNIPSTSNELQVQIIPPTDNTYRKINMMFYVTDISAENGIIQGSAVYKIPGLLNSKANALGEITTYELCDKISIDSQLGFASNVASTEDKRFVYCDFKTYGDMLKDEIQNSLADKTHVYDCWVDLWNYIILCDVYERYTTVDKESDMTIWVADHNTIGVVGEKVEPFQTECVLTNHPVAERTELFVRKYEVLTDNQYIKQGTEKAVMVYNMNTKEYVGHYVADGDVEKNQYINLEYGGEVYGDYDYIFSKQCRDMFMKKMKSEIIELTLTSPLFSISRGDQCRFVWLDNDTRNRYWRETLQQAQITPAAGDIPTDDMTWLNGWASSVANTKADDLYVNLQISGQYTVIGMKAAFEYNNWVYKLQLVRPAERRPQLLIDLNANE